MKVKRVERCDDWLHMGDVSLNEAYDLSVQRGREGEPRESLVLDRAV